MYFLTVTYCNHRRTFALPQIKHWCIRSVVITLAYLLQSDKHFTKPLSENGCNPEKVKEVKKRDVSSTLSDVNTTNDGNTQINYLYFLQQLFS